MSWPPGPVTVRVPATSANLGPGFDSFGLALTLHDQISARITSGSVEVQVTGCGRDTAEHGEKHLVIRAMRAAFLAIGRQPAGIALSCRNAVPHGFGLGSSAAAIVAGLIAARALAGPEGQDALPDADLLTLASLLEGHPDNVAACLAGGLTIAWQSPSSTSASAPVAYARLEPLPELAPVVCVPVSPLATELARKALPLMVSHADAAANSARAALLVTALTSRPDLLMTGTEDFLHQRHRADAAPATSALVAELRAAGIPAVVSGAGPSVLALPADETGAHAVADLAARSEGGEAWQALLLHIDRAGAQVLSS